MKVNSLGNNPFKAGPATLPLHVAGREEELDIINDVLEAITLPRKEGEPLSESPLAPLRIVGPRGVGKTTLLNMALKQAEQLGVYAVQAVELKSLTSADKFLYDLAGEKKVMEDLLERVKQLSVGPVSVGLNQPEGRDLFFEEALLIRLRKQPVMILLDEAMHYEAEALGSLLRICQKLIAGYQPLALILAGTPQVEQHLERVQASFIERTTNIYINTLSDAATREALAKPFELRGAGLSAPALRQMVKLTDNYPFFIQIVGYEVWKAMRAAGKCEAGLAEVRGVAAKIDKKRNQFYKLIHSRIFSTSLLGHARRLIKVLAKNNGKITRLTALAVLAGKKMEVYGEEHFEILNQLLDRGFIWEGDAGISAGIPSFFDYCRKEEAKSKREKT